MTFAKGFAKPAPSASPPFVLLLLEAAKGSGILTPPSPALRSAICVVSLLNMALAGWGDGWWGGGQRGRGVWVSWRAGELCGVGLWVLGGWLKGALQEA